MEDELRWKYTDGSDSNEIICFISPDNYTLVTKILKGNEHNYVADTLGQWTSYTMCTVVCKSLLLDYGNQMKQFPYYTP